MFEGAESGVMPSKFIETASLSLGFDQRHHKNTTDEFAPATTSPPSLRKNVSIIFSVVETPSGFASGFSGPKNQDLGP